MEGFCEAAAAASAAGDPWFFNPCLVIASWPAWAYGFWITLQLTAFSLVLGFLLAVPCAFSIADRGPAAPLARAYVYVFRGTPLLVQTYLLYYGLAQFDVIRDSPFWGAPGWLRGTAAADYWPNLREAWWCALIAFTLNSAAYQTEILRGGVAATPRGEKEAAVALGMSRWLVRRRIVLPSALRRTIPQMGNEVVFMMHGSSIASIITIQDILGVGRMINGRYYVVYEGLLTAAALYMALTYALVVAFRRLERRYTRHLSRS